MASAIEFDWDGKNKKHLAAHKVAPAEFEQVLNNDPIDLAFDLIDDEERHRSVGLTNRGRLLSITWTIRNGKVRAIAASNFSADRLEQALKVSDAEGLVRYVAVQDRYNLVAEGDVVGIDHLRDAQRYQVDGSGIVVLPRGSSRFS